MFGACLLYHILPWGKKQHICREESVFHMHAAHVLMLELFLSRSLCMCACKVFLISLWTDICPKHKQEEGGSDVMLGESVSASTTQTSFGLHHYLSRVIVSPWRLELWLKSVFSAQSDLDLWPWPPKSYQSIESKWMFFDKTEELSEISCPTEQDRWTDRGPEDITSNSVAGVEA